MDEKIEGISLQLVVQVVVRYQDGSEQPRMLDGNLVTLTHLLHHVGGSRSFPTGCSFENGLVTRFLSA